jgi:shikimate kinase
VEEIKNIILLGMPYSGKSSVGELISKKLNFNFFDSDELIEKIEDMSINDIFLSKGEEFFRNDECELFSMIKDQNNMVLACGAGMPCHDDILKKFKKIGITVCLKVPLNVLNERKKQDYSRPLLKVKGTDKLLEFLDERSSVYLNADIVIEAEKLSIEELALKVINKIMELR